MARSELILETAQEELEIDTEKVLGKIQERARGKRFKRLHIGARVRVDIFQASSYLRAR